MGRLLPIQSENSYRRNGRLLSGVEKFLCGAERNLRARRIPPKQEEIFLCQLIDNAEIIRDMLSEPLRILRDKYYYQLTGLNDEEIKELHSCLPPSAFTDSQGRYHKTVDDSAKKIKSK